LAPAASSDSAPRRGLRLQRQPGIMERELHRCDAVGIGVQERDRVLGTEVRRFDAGLAERSRPGMTRPPSSASPWPTCGQGLHPRVRRIGTLGRRPEPAAQLFLPLVGQGRRACGASCRGARRSASRIEPPDLGPKDAIALLNANAYSIGTGALALHDAGLALQAQTAPARWSLEAAGANLSPTILASWRFDPRRTGRRLTTDTVADQSSDLLKPSIREGCRTAVVSLPRPVNGRPSTSSLAQQQQSSPISMVRRQPGVLVDDEN